MSRRIAQLPLHSGKAPAYLFRRMVKLAGAVTMAVVDEFGPQEMLRRLSDPWWFQAFGCVLGFDWHSSGVTTVTCGALKEAGKQCRADLGIFIAGGKGGTSRKTPDEIAATSDQFGISSGEKLIYASKMSAKVDSAALQDGYQLYHHCLFFTQEGDWCVVQQGMNETEHAARRYHWLGDHVDDFVCEPHNAIARLNQPAAEKKQAPKQLTLWNMVAEEAEDNRQASADLVLQNPDWLLEQAKCLTEGPTLFAPRHHRVRDADINVKHLRKIVIDAHEKHPQDFETLLGLRGIGPAAVRSLSLLAELIYQTPASHRDPALTGRPFVEQATVEPVGERQSPTPRWADYSYAHGGKDGTPFPVDRQTYDRSIAVLTDAVRKARLGENDKAEALKRLAGYHRLP